MLRLLRLDEKVIEAVSGMGEAPSRQFVSERTLRALFAYPPSGQRGQLALLLGEPL